MWREDLDPVPERVARVEAVVAGKRFVEEDRNASRGQPIAECREVVDEERWVGLAGGDELLLDAEMDLDRGGAEPAATAALKGARFRHSRDTQEARVERLGLCLSARRHRELDVVDGPDHRTALPDRLAAHGASSNSHGRRDTPGERCLHPADAGRDLPDRRWARIPARRPSLSVADQLHHRHL
jgi:hypothetical protein